MVIWKHHETSTCTSPIVAQARMAGDAAGTALDARVAVDDAATGSSPSGSFTSEPSSLSPNLPSILNEYAIASTHLSNHVCQRCDSENSLSLSLTYCLPRYPCTFCPSLNPLCICVYLSAALRIVSAASTCRTQLDSIACTCRVRVEGCQAS